jgi:hypothetical protein
MSKKLYKVVYEARKHNAIGVFCQLTGHVYACDEEEARQFFCDKFADTYEFRFPVSTTEVKDGP